MEHEKGLDGLTVGIPAARRATETAQLVRRWGGVPMVGPTVREITAADATGVVEATRSVIASDLSWCVHLTGAGTRRWLQLAGAAGLREALLDRLAATDLIARGQKTKTALAEVSLTAAWIPAGETSAEIARWLTPQLAEGQIVAVQLHGEPAPELSRAITNSGARLIEVESYSWDLPEDLEPARQLVRAIVDRRVDALTITSAPQARFLARIAGDLGLREELVNGLRDHVYLAAVGSVAADGLQELGLTADLIASPARMGALVRQMAGDRSRILAKAGVA